jgi:uncharacterized membrane protein HdeD (DUF308 family)
MMRMKKETDLLIKGLLIAGLGLCILIGPLFMADPAFRSIVTDSYLVGWFALLLGGVFIAQYCARRWKQARQDKQLR